MVTRFQGRTALVTGAGSGIGAATARALSRERARVVLSGRRLERLEQVRDAIEDGAGATLALPLDVRDEQAVERAFDHAAEVLGPVEVLALCHGINRIRTLDELDDATWQEVLATNLTGTFHCLRAALRRMRPRDRGRIAVVSSVSGRQGYVKYPGFAAYCASKYGLTGLVEVAAAEIAGSGIGLAMLCPGGVDTDMFRTTFPGQRAALTADDVARSLLDLLDPETAPPQGTIIEMT